MTGAKSSWIIFSKVDEFITDYDGTKCLVVLFGLEKYNAIYDRIRYLTGLKSDFTCNYFHNYAKIKIYSDDDLPLEKTLNLHNAVIIIKSVLNENENHKYCNIFLEKWSYELPKK